MEEQNAAKKERDVEVVTEEKDAKKEISESQEDVDGELVLWNAENKEAVKKSPSTTPPQSQPTTEASTPTATAENPTAAVAPPDVQPTLQIGGILAVNKDELLKRLMNPHRNSRKKHFIVIDGPNIARRHGKETDYSGEGIKIALDYYNRRGHDAIAFLPQQYVKRKPGTGPVTLAEYQPKATNVPMLLELVDKGQLVLTPPQDYDDTYVIEYAMSQNGCIVSNDRYWDYIEKKEKEKGQKAKWEAKKWIHEHLISFTFVRNEFLPNPNFKFPPLE